LVQAAAASGVPESVLPTFLHFYVLQQKIADKLLARYPVSQAALQAEYDKQKDQFDQVHAAHILVKTKQQADQLLRQVRKNPSSFASLASRFSLDTGSKSNGGDLGLQPHSQFVPEFADAVFKAKPGTFIEVHSQFGWHVVHVIAHQVTTLAQATPQLKAQILQSQVQNVLQGELSAVGKKLGVHVNPRYGVWNNAKGAVDPAPVSRDVSSPVATPAT
jgi:parvulin-like peptidyl-prolyl isomerase